MTLTQERNREFLKLYEGENPRTLDPKHYPAPRFFITEKQAERLIYAFIKHRHPVSPEKQRLQQELHRTYCRLLPKHKGTQQDLFSKVVMSPAPEFFMSAIAIRNAIKSNSL